MEVNKAKFLPNSCFGGNSKFKPYSLHTTGTSEDTDSARNERLKGAICDLRTQD
jgi:hypothetical protein